jgi:hypothetical protein
MGNDEAVRKERTSELWIGCTVEARKSESEVFDLEQKTNKEKCCKRVNKRIPFLLYSYSFIHRYIGIEIWW